MPRDAIADESYERAMVRLEAALDLALSSDSEAAESNVAVRRHLDAARSEIARVRAGEQLPGSVADVALARMLARRIIEDPRLSLTSQKARGEIALRSLLHG